MKKVLVFGGTRFFGKRLVEKLIHRGHDVTIATRGNTKDSFGDHVRRVVLDREVGDEHFQQLSYEKWDIVYDNICYSSNDMKIGLDILKDCTKKYVFTSSLSVYDEGNGSKAESDFNPFNYEIKMGGREDFTYQEGKRLGEAVLFQRGDIPAVAVRFPIVLGEDDYTKRLHWHVNRVEKAEPIYFPNIDAKTCFITSEEAAEVLVYVGENDIVGPVNASASGEISMKELVRLIEGISTKKAVLVQSLENDGDHSPFGFNEDCYMNIDKLCSSGMQVSNLNEWFPQLISAIYSMKE